MTSQPRDAALESLLRRAAPPPPDPQAAARTAALLGTLPPPRPAGWRFLAVQAGFIRKGMWAAQFAVLACVVGLMRLADGASPRCCALCAAAAPLLLVANVQDLARVYHQGLLELELATRYSLPKVTAARLLVFGLYDAALLALLAAAGAATARTGLGAALLYCLTPFCFVSALCLGLLGHLRPAAFHRAALGVAAGTVLLALLPLRPVQRWLYSPGSRVFWAGALVLSLLALAWQTRRLLRGGLPATL